MSISPSEPLAIGGVLRHMVAFSPMTADDLAEVLELWRQTPGVGLNESDSPDALGRFLARNPGLSRVARQRETLVAAVLCGHDGRRGFLYHLAGLLATYHHENLNGR